MEQEFKEYLKQARLDFANVANKYPLGEHLELRTAIDSLLIAYDQAIDQALRQPLVVGRSEQLKAFREWWNKDNEGVCTTITHRDIERYLKSL